MDSIGNFDFDSLKSIEKEYLFYKLEQLGYDYNQYSKYLEEKELYFFNQFHLKLLNGFYFNDIRNIINYTLTNKSEKYISQDDYNKLEKFFTNIFIFKENFGFTPQVTFKNFLQLEFEIKSKKKFLSHPIKKNSISASDVANYTYCPVSYSINKSIFLPIQSELAEIGTEKHKEELLLNFLHSKGEDAQFEIELDSKDTMSPLKKGFFNEVLNSQTIYSNKDISTKPYFNNKIFYGQPDYILVGN